MIFDDLSALLHMGGHGLFVWGSYALALAVIVFNVVQPLFLRRRVIAGNRRRLVREEQQ